MPSSSMETHDTPPHLPSTTAHFNLPSLIPPLTASPENLVLKEEGDAEMTAIDGVDEASTRSETSPSEEEETAAVTVREKEASLDDLMMGGEKKLHDRSESEEERLVDEELGPLEVIGGRVLPGQMTQDQAEIMERSLHLMLDDFES